MEQSPERNGKANPSNVWGELWKATASMNTLRVLDILKEEQVAQQGYHREKGNEF